MRWRTSPSSARVVRYLMVMRQQPMALHARPPLAHRECLSQMDDSFPLPRGRHHFFLKRSFSAALSSMASASNRFSRVFSSASVFSRLADLLPAELGFPLVNTGVADTMLAAKISD